MIDVNPNHLETITRILAEHVPECEVRAFGSRVTWTAKDYSDLDLAVVAGGALDSDALRRLKEAFEESNLPFRVDVLDWHAIRSSFRKVIEKKYEVVQKGKQKRLGMAGEWRSSTWGEEISLEYGKALRGHDEAQGRYRVFGANGPIGWTSRPLAPGPGVILGRKGAYRGVQYSPEPFFVIDTAYYVVPKNELDMRWLYYAIKHYKLGEVDDGSPIPSTTRSAVYMLDLEVPPPPEQRAIAHILGTLDDKIELNRRMNETLEAMARALFKSWFIDFDPVRAKAEGRDTGLPKPLADLFPDSFEDSELGEIPKGWEVGSLGQVAEVIDCLHSTKPDRRKEGLPLLQLSNIRDDGLIDMEDTYFIDEQDYRKWIPRMEASPGDCLITNVGRVGAVAQMPVGQKAALGRNMTGLRCKSSFPNPTFLIECLLSQAMRDEFVLKTDTGTILDALNVRSIPELRFVHSPSKILPRFEEVARPLRARMEQNLRESRTLAALRDTLLPKLISGELRVQDAARVAGRVV